MTLGRNTIMRLSRQYAASESAKKAVARGSWFEKRTIIPNGLWSNITAGRPLGRPLRTTNSFPTSHEPRTTNNKKSTGIFQCFFYKNQRLPILPGGLPPSTFGVCGLNCCVRHGNRWIPATIATELDCSGFVS